MIRKSFDEKLMEQARKGMLGEVCMNRDYITSVHDRLSRPCTKIF
jgi:hypothetical protein